LKNLTILIEIVKELVKETHIKFFSNNCTDQLSLNFPNRYGNKV